MRGDHLVRHLHTHYDRIADVMDAPRRQQCVERRLPIVSNRVTAETKTQTFALCLVCKKGATYWTHSKPSDFLRTHYAQSPQCFSAPAFEAIRPLLEREALVDPMMVAPVRGQPTATVSEPMALKPAVQVALDFAVAYEADDEEEESEEPKTLSDKVEALLGQYKTANRVALRRAEEVRKLRSEVELTREMMRLYRRAAVRYRRGERLLGCKRSIAIARRELADLRAGAEASSDTGDLSSASDRSC